MTSERTAVVTGVSGFAGRQLAAQLADAGWRVVGTVRSRLNRARAMLADAIDAFIRGDAVAGRAICRRDDEVDALNRSVFRILLTYMVEDPQMISSGLEIVLVSRNLERVADLATNIAEGVVFLVEGKSIKHRM